jgi:sugar O-acyltransferase (sialic acid O-acetyltransferase NeuD family)
MIIAGAGGHAREIFDLLDADMRASLYFFDNVNEHAPKRIAGSVVLRTIEEAAFVLQKDRRFIVGTGQPSVREKLYDLIKSIGGIAFTCKAASSFVSEQNVFIGEGTNIMHDVFISNHVSLGRACLINTRAHVHHDVVAGDFCEVGPAALLLGHVQLGNHVQVGAGAVVLPCVQIGSGAVIGAGSVVTKNIGEGVIVKGNPAA